MRKLSRTIFTKLSKGALSSKALVVGDHFKDKDELLAFVQEDALAGLLEIAARVRETGLRADAIDLRLLDDRPGRFHPEGFESALRVGEGQPGR